MADKYKLIGGPHSRFEGGSRVTYYRGDIIEGLTEDELESFGFKFELVEEEQDVTDYHVGGGWYDVPNRENNVRKEEAIKALEEGG